MGEEKIMESSKEVSVSDARFEHNDIYFTNKLIIDRRNGGEENMNENNNKGRQLSKVLVAAIIADIVFVVIAGCSYCIRLGSEYFFGESAK